MIPFLERGVALVATQGYDLVARRTPLKKVEGVPPTSRDLAIDAALAAAAILPAMINVFGPSPVIERFHSLSLKNIYRLYKARPYLDAVTVGAIGVLAFRQKSTRSDGRWLNRSLRTVGALRFSANLLSPPSAYDPHGEGHLVVTPRELDRLLEPEDEVLGLVLNGEVRCYPLKVLRKPHFLHDTVGGVPVAPTFCERSGAALAFRDEWQGQRLDLNVAGYSNNNVVFYEGHSDGMIQQLAAEIGAGPNEGDPLQVFPMTRTTWKHWRELHPETTGLWYDQGVKGTAIQKVLEYMEKRDEAQEEPTYAMRGPVDHRLAPMEEVLGVRVKGVARAYTRAYLAANPVLNEEIAGEPVVVFYDAHHDLAACFSRRLGDQLLHFREAVHGKGVAEDKETGRLWDVTGCSQDGESRCLRPVPYMFDRIRWFVWAHFEPQTQLAQTQGQALMAP